MKFLRVLLIVCVWCMCIAAIDHVNRIYKADQLAVEASDLLEKMEYERALKKADEAIRLNSQEPSYYRTRALVYLAKHVLEKDRGDRLGYKEKAYQDVVKAVGLNPDNLVTKRNLVPIFYFLSVKNVNVAAGKENHDPKYIEIASRYFDELKKQYSHDVGVITLVAGYERKLGLEDDYEESKKMVESLRPDLLEWHESFN